MAKKILLLSLFLILVSFSIHRFLTDAPLATWQYYSNNGEMITGHYYAPEENSATDVIRVIPEIPDKNGLQITTWNDCHLRLRIDNKELNVTYFTDGLIQASLSTRTSPYTSLMELYFYQPNDMHWSITRSEDGTYKGWIWDNIANQLVAVHYQEDRTTLIEGTQYTLMPDSYWLYQRWENAILVEEYKLDDLPAKDAFIPDMDKQKLLQAKEQFQKSATELAASLNLPFPLQLWNNIPCEL